MKQNEARSEERAVRLEAIYPHPIERVWQALTSPEALREWLLPTTFQPVLGHRFRLTQRRPGGKRERVHCEVVELDAPRRVAYTWRAEDEDAPSLVSWTLEAVEDGTRILLEHLPLELAAAPHASRSSPLSNAITASSLPGMADALADLAKFLNGLPISAALHAPRRGRIVLARPGHSLRCIGNRVKPEPEAAVEHYRILSACRSREVTLCAR
jgi:uncharacterized protein YndB with AHSA1/START domain